MNSTYTSQDYAAFILRIAFGVTLLAHAYLKIFVFTIAGTVGFFESLGLPAFVAYLTILGELGGGIAILAGLYTRLSAILTLPIMAGATWVHFGNGWVFSADGGGWQFPALLIVLAAVVALQGAGAYAVRNLPVIDDFIPAALRG